MLLTRSVEAVLHVPQGLRAPQGDAVLLAVVEGGHRAVLGVQLHQELVERSRLLNIGQVAEAEKVKSGSLNLPLWPACENILLETAQLLNYSLAM